MEYRNAGILGLAEIDLLFMQGLVHKIKLGPDPLLISNIPFFHHSIIPWGIPPQRPPIWGHIKP
jgi:hypothetical protein